MKRSLLACAVLLSGCDALLDFDKLRHGHGDGGNNGDGGSTGACTAPAAGPFFDYTHPSETPVAYDGEALTIADIDGDGDLDVVMNGSDEQIHALINGGGRTLSDTLLVSSPVCKNGQGHSVLVADFDGDKNVDLVVACDALFTNGVDKELWFLHGEGSASFDAPVAFAALPTNAGDALVADLDQDGLPDAVVLDDAIHGFVVHWGDPAAFTTQAPLTVPVAGLPTVRNIVSGPLGAPGDTVVDIVLSGINDATDTETGKIAIARRDRSSGRSYNVAVTDELSLTADPPIALGLGRLGSDSRLGLYVAGGATDFYFEVGMAAADQSTTFTLPTATVGTEDGENHLAVGDLNCDGKDDAVLTHFRYNDEDDADIYDVYKAGGVGLSRAPNGGGVDNETTGAPSTDNVRIADLDGDGLPDIIMTYLSTTDSGSDGVRVLWGLAASP